MKTLPKMCAYFAAKKLCTFGNGFDFSNCRSPQNALKILTKHEKPAFDVGGDFTGDRFTADWKLFASSDRHSPKSSLPAILIKLRRITF